MNIYSKPVAALLIGIALLQFSFEARAASLSSRINPIVDDFYNQGLLSGTLLVRRGGDEYVRGVGLASDITLAPNTLFRKWLYRRGYVKPALYIM